MLDDEETSELSIGGRMDAEAEMRRRDMTSEGRKAARMRRGILYGVLVMNDMTMTMSL